MDKEIGHIRKHTKVIVCILRMQQENNLKKKVDPAYDGVNIRTLNYSVFHQLFVDSWQMTSH